MIRVIKLGGSLLAASVIPACLDVVERMPGRNVIVPGGGLFADQVRDAQQRFGFDDIAAHRMAILAMQQMAWLYHSFKPGFRLFDLNARSDDLPGAVIWLPEPVGLDRAGIAASWDISSDSLAAWLAERLQAVELIVVKSAKVSDTATLAVLLEQSVVDAAFPKFADRVPGKVTVVDKDRFLSMS